MPGLACPRRSTATRPTARGSARATTWPGSTAPCTPTHSRATTPLPDPAGPARPYPARRLLGTCTSETVRGARGHQVAHRRGGAAAHSGALPGRGRDHRQDGCRTPAERQARSKPLLADLKAWMEAQRRRRASGKTVLGKALQYALGRWGGADPLRRRRQARHRQQCGRTAAARNCHQPARTSCSSAPTRAASAPPSSTP